MPAETKIVAQIPTRLDDGKNVSIQNVATLAKGVYITDTQVLTVAHAVPRNASAAGFKEIKYDEEKHLLLLEAKTCGVPLAISSSPITKGDVLHDCTSDKSYGAISDFEDSAFSDSPLSSFSVMLNNLAVLPGDFVIGDSGKPFCNNQGELVAILVAVREQSALLIPLEQIRTFLN